MSLRDAYRQKIEASLAENKAKLDVLRARAKRAAAQGRILAYEELANADTHLTDAKAKLKVLANAGSHAFTELKSGVSQAYADLKTASKRAAEHLRTDGAASPPASAKPRTASRPKKVRRAPARRASTVVRAKAKRR